MTEGRHTVCQEVRAELAWEEWRDFRGMPADVSSRASERVLARINTQCRHSEPAGTSAASLGKCILRESLRLLTWFVTGSSGLEFLYTAAKPGQRCWVLGHRACASPLDTREGGRERGWWRRERARRRDQVFFSVIVDHCPASPGAA